MPSKEENLEDVEETPVAWKVVVKLNKLVVKGKGKQVAKVTKEGKVAAVKLEPTDKTSVPGKGKNKKTKGILLQEQITSARDHPTPDKEEVTNCGNQPNFRKVSLVLITTQIWLPWPPYSLLIPQHYFFTLFASPVRIMQPASRIGDQELKLTSIPLHTQHQFLQSLLWVSHMGLLTHQ